MDLIFLAGGAVSDISLKEKAFCGYKALIKFEGQFMANITLSAFRNARYIKNIYLAAPNEIKQHINPGYYDKFIPCSGDMLDNLLIAINNDKINKSKKIIISSCDLPLLTPAAVDNFAGFSLNSRFEAIYPVVTKKNYDLKYHEAPRTWIKCHEETYTGGNFISITPDIILKNIEIIKNIYLNRKNPLKLASTLGIKTLLKYQAGLLTKKHVEAVAESIIKTPSFGFVSEFGEIVLDIDKIGDYSVALEIYKNDVNNKNI